MSYDAKPIGFYEPAISTPQILQAINTFLKSWLPKHSKSDDLNLYHYTTLEGLKGILKSRSIWFTHISTLNDPTELEYGRQLILDLLYQELNKDHEGIIKNIIQELIGKIQRFNEIEYETYVACFCESDNLLSQWRGYATKGGGYNLGLVFTSDIQFYHSLNDTEEKSYVILRKIEYDEDEQKRLISTYVSLIVKSAYEATKYNDNIHPAWESMAAMESVNILFDLMLSFKNKVFSEENEWRLIKVRQADHKVDQLHFRDNNKTLIPYLETHIIEKLEKKFYFPIHTIKFGPVLDVSSTSSALKLFIMKESVSDNKIKINANGIRISGAGYSLRE